MIVRLGVEDTRKWANNNSYSWINSSPEERKGVLEFLNVIEPYLSKDIQVRTEGSHFNIFCKDRSLNADIITDVKKWLKATHGPDSDEELEFMLASGQKKVVCNKFPHDKFRYKINLKTTMPVSARATFLSWAEKYDGKISIADSTNRWLKGKTHYVQAPFMYVEDDKTLAMFGLFLGNNVRIVEEFILRSSININLNQE